VYCVPGQGWAALVNGGPSLLVGVRLVLMCLFCVVLCCSSGPWLVAAVLLAAAMRTGPQLASSTVVGFESGSRLAGLFCVSFVRLVGLFMCLAICILRMYF
jgi:hypothetical protein